MVKFCHKCQSELDFEQFGKDKSTKDGLTTCCKPCRKAMLANWKAKNPGKAKEATARWTAKNIEKVREAAKINQRSARSLLADGEYAKIQKEWRTKNPLKAAEYQKKNVGKVGRDVVNQRNRQYRKAAPSAYAEYDAKKRAKRLKRHVVWADRSRVEKFYEEAKSLQQATGKSYHVDHVIPLLGKNVCGLHNEFNLRVIPAMTNLKKGNKYDPDMLDEETRNV
jgi:hypothetical protein